MVLKWRLIKEVLRVAPDYAKAQNLSSYGAGENTMVVEDALSRIDSILEMQPLKETEKKEIPADTSITFENVSFRYKGASEDKILSHEVQDGTTMMDNQEYDIAFQNVGFSYNIGDAVLKDVTFTAKQGEVTALIGPSFLPDEATASLDVDNETMIQESLSRLIKNKTVMIIAHRMRTVADADKIVVLKDGVVAESGTPEELKKKDGIYANMMKTQLMAADWSL